MARVGAGPDLRIVPSSEVQRALAVRGFLARGALEGVVAAGGKLDGAFAQLHRLFDGDDLQAGHGGEAGFLMQAGRGGLGHHGLGRFGQVEVALVGVRLCIYVRCGLGEY